MGVTPSLADRIDRIFARMTNFDISGFCNPDLVTPELADAIINMTSEDRKELLHRGYGFSWFKPDASDGIVYKEYRLGSFSGVLKLYYNPYYPAEMALMKKGDKTQNGSGN